ncbi:TolC family protein [Flavobacterium lacus]|uniref:Outer membrane protein TolC n=1 Tax=Flavobacterium lacus TaxID=1353778 RepID=A0A328WVP0_9FLAO|nr:TolC family protein [Flavobacterium lacus]RAR50430.1 outer membrane protein TolC [Flavobacterium lacus]
MKKLSLFLLLACLGIQAQETKQSYSFSLKQAIEHALQYNYSVINSGRDIEAAKKKKWETTASGLPQINAGLDYANNFKLQTQAVSGNLFDPDGDPNQISTFAFGTKHSMVARSTLSQLIFDGSYIVALQASKTYLQYYESSKKKTDLQVREMIINSYGNVLLAEENIAILEKNKATLDKTLFDTEQTFKNGLIEEENVEQLKITLSSINSSLNYTKRLKDISYNMLKINLGIELEEELSLTDKLENLTTSNLDMALTGSSFEVKNSIDYALSTNFVEQRTLEMKLEKSKFLPSLSANLNFGYNAFGDQFAFFTQNQRWFNYSNLGVGLNVPIFSSFGKNAKVQQSKIALEQAQTQLTETEQRLKLQYQNAKSDYEYSVEQYFSSKENLSLAERIEKKQQVKFTEGLSTSFEFTDAQRQLYSAQQSYLQSMVDVISRKAALEKAIGKTN